MTSAASPLAEAFRDWQAAGVVLRHTLAGSPEWEEAALMADDAGWRYRSHVAETTGRLVAASDAALTVVDELRFLARRRDATTPNSETREFLSARLRDAASRLVILTDEEKRHGDDLPLSGDTILTIRRDGL